MSFHQEQQDKSFTEDNQKELEFERNKLFEEDFDIFSKAKSAYSVNIYNSNNITNTNEPTKYIFYNCNTPNYSSKNYQPSPKYATLSEQKTYLASSRKRYNITKSPNQKILLSKDLKHASTEEELDFNPHEYNESERYTLLRAPRETPNIFVSNNKQFSETKSISNPGKEEYNNMSFSVVSLVKEEDYPMNQQSQIESHIKCGTLGICDNDQRTNAYIELVSDPCEDGPDKSRKAERIYHTSSNNKKSIQVSQIEEKNKLSMSALSNTWEPITPPSSPIQQLIGKEEKFFKIPTKFPNLEQTYKIN